MAHCTARCQEYQIKRLQPFTHPSAGFAQALVPPSPCCFHQCCNFLGIVIGPLLQGHYNFLSPFLGLILIEFPFPFKPRDLDTKADDLPHEPIQKVTRSTQRPRLRHRGFVDSHEVSDDLEKGRRFFDGLHRSVSVDSNVVPGRNDIFGFVPRRRNIGMRPGKDGKNLLPLDVLPLWIRSCHVANQTTLRT